MVTMYVPAIAGMPLSSPPGVSVNPGGKRPEVKTYGATPPLAFTVCDRATPTVAADSEDVVTVTTPAAVGVTELEALDAALEPTGFVALTVNV